MYNTFQYHYDVVCRTRAAEQKAQDEAQKFLNEISSLKQNIKQLQVQLSQKAKEL